MDELKKKLMFSGIKFKPLKDKYLKASLSKQK